MDGRDPGELKDLKRHLVCLDRKTGDIKWDKTVDPVLPEDEFRGMFAENGYATHTPVSDGEHVYAFFGKSGVVAFDNDGKQLWQTKVGSDLDNRGWGSASSPILYKNLVIVAATVENHSLVALNKETGEKVWEQEAEGFGSTWGTPVLVELPEGRTDLVIGVPYEIWGLNPDTGKLLWYCDGVPSSSMCSSVLPSTNSPGWRMNGLSAILDTISSVRMPGAESPRKTSASSITSPSFRASVSCAYSSLCGFISSVRPL